MLAPVSFQDVSINMRTPGFWISKINNPDKVILTKDKINALNTKTRDTKHITNVLDLKSYFQKESLIEDYNQSIKKFAKYYDGLLSKRIGIKYFNEIGKNIHIF